MQLTDSEIALLRKSFDRLREERTAHDPFGRSFYDKLFARLPEARALFRSDLSEQGMRFLSTLGVILGALDRPAEAEETLSRLAEGHRLYGVKPDHYPPMGEALMETMRETLGPKFDAETEAAWRKAYAGLTERMLAAA